jgi:hypothetical protein
LVGGYLLIWFGVAGALALFVLWPRLSLPGWRALGAGFLVFVALWVGMGLLGGEVWLPWLLIPRRLALWPLGSLSFLLWSLAVGEASKSARPWGKIGWWLLQSAVVVGSMLLAIQLSSGLYFVMLILPLFPLMLGAHALAAGRQSNSWAFALGAALFVSWAVLAVFPISG